MPGQADYVFPFENGGFEENLPQDLNLDFDLGYLPDANYSLATNDLSLDIQYQRNVQSVDDFQDPNVFLGPNFGFHELSTYPDGEALVENLFPDQDNTLPQIDFNQAGTWIIENDNSYIQNTVRMSNPSNGANHNDFASLDALCSIFEPENQYGAVPSRENLFHTPRNASTSSNATFPKVMTPASSDKGSSSCCQPTLNTEMCCDPENEPNSATFNRDYVVVDIPMANMNYSPKADDNVGTMNIGAKKRGKLSSAQKNKINAVRKMSACIRCQMMRESCDECDEDDAYRPCRNCILVAATAKIWRSPCFRGRISDAVLFRTGWVSLPNGVRDIKEWTSNSKVHIEFFSSGLAYQDFPMKRNKTIKITCQEFRPLPGDGTERKWNDGQSVVRIPSYAIAKNHYSPTRKALETYFNENRDSFLEELDINQDELVKLTLKEARRQANRSEMLYHALDICILAKLCSTTLKIPDDGRAESLGIPRIVDPAGWRHYGRRPTPVMLDAQIATIWMGIMGKARKRLLSELKKKILGRKRENWYIIYLTTFIILWNLEYIYEHQKERVDLFSKKHPRQSFPHLCFAMMDQWRVAAENILAHFHTISQGNIPFSINWDENEAQRIANVDAKAVEYLNKVRAILDERGDYLCQAAQEPPGTPLVWISSLFFPNTTT